MHETQQAQTNDQRLMQKAQEDHQPLIICHWNHPRDPNWEIAVPQELIQHLIMWYDLVLRQYHLKKIPLSWIEEKYCSMQLCHLPTEQTN